MHQVVNLRTGHAPWLASHEAQQEHEAACDAARLTQTVPYAVAPGARVLTRRGLRGPGEEVTVEDIVGADGRPAWAELDLHVFEMRVIARD